MKKNRQPTTANRQRLDQLLLDRGLADSKAKAQALILSGNVYSENKRLDKPGAQVRGDLEIMVKGQEHPWVSRGGMKLDRAITEFGIDVRGMTAIDVGASTGGFTDVLLHYGAAKVYAVDVGHGQLAWKLRSDPRVVVLEKCNARYLTVEQIPDPVDIIVCDASFISLKTVLPAALTLAKGRGAWGEGREETRDSPLATRPCLIALIKPQFEVGKDQVGKGGVVRDETLQKEVCDDIAAWATDMGWEVKGITDSPITGPAGNKEFLIYAVRL